MRIRLHAFEPASRANGPGPRAAVWFQGCTLGCPGCFNPDTHPHEPRLVILDDPVLGLDTIMRKEFLRDVVTHLQGKEGGTGGVTVFFS